MSFIEPKTARSAPTIRRQYYQAWGRMLAELRRLNEVFAPEPDLLVLLDVPTTVGLERIHTRGDRANHFEQTRTLQRAREIFNQIDKPYLYKLAGQGDPTAICDGIVRQFSALAANRVARSNGTSREQLNAVLDLFGGVRV